MWNWKWSTRVNGLLFNDTNDPDVPHYACDCEWIEGRDDRHRPPIHRCTTQGAHGAQWEVSESAGIKYPIPARFGKMNESS
jgi:hypothetical protein